MKRFPLRRGHAVCGRARRLGPTKGQWRTGASAENTLTERVGRSFAVAGSVQDHRRLRIQTTEGSTMGKIAEGAWEGHSGKRPSIITKTEGGGRLFQTQRADGTWRQNESPAPGGSDDEGDAPG